MLGPKFSQLADFVRGRNDDEGDDEKKDEERKKGASKKESKRSFRFGVPKKKSSAVGDSRFASTASSGAGAGAAATAGVAVGGAGSAAVGSAVGAVGGGASVDEYGNDIIDPLVCHYILISLFHLWEKSISFSPIPPPTPHKSTFFSPRSFSAGRR